MINENSLIVYKNKPAIVKEKSEGKFTILLQDAGQQRQVKVRDKDIDLLHPGPVKDFNVLEAEQQKQTPLSEVWELLSGEDAPVSLKDFAALVYGEYTPYSAYAAYCLLADGLYFCGTVSTITPRSMDEVAAEQERRTEKSRQTDERSQFLERLKVCIKKGGGLIPDDARFMQDVQALAFGKSSKSRTMKDLGLGETAEDAHALLLKTSLWTSSVNPHPVRCGISLSAAGFCSFTPPCEDRRDLCRLEAFAIDSPWSDDPDDAVSIEVIDDKRIILYVHVADPACCITPGSPEETEARDRGATLYLPETVVRMLPEESLSVFALGFGEKSIALTFKMTLDESSKIINTEIFASIVKVQRITYEQADKELNFKDTERSDALRALYNLAQLNFKRRCAAGAVNIELPETRIYIEGGQVKIDRIPSYHSAFIVKECMIIACEGSAAWAAGNGLAFPFIGQEVEMQGKIPQGIAGSWALRKCMRPRILSVKPARHQGLGLDIYTQVTSPLRRYTDLLTHMQIRAFLRGGKTLNADEISARLGYSEAASTAVVQAERSSNNHWTMVYLEDKKDSVWEAAVLEKKGGRWAVIIPALALETQAALHNDVAPNANVKLILKSVNIPKCEAVFVCA